MQLISAAAMLPILCRNFIACVKYPNSMFSTNHGESILTARAKVGATKHVLSYVVCYARTTIEIT